jgi:hypothetical protein
LRAAWLLLIRCPSWSKAKSAASIGQIHAFQSDRRPTPASAARRSARRLGATPPEKRAMARIINSARGSSPSLRRASIVIDA